MNKRCVFGFAVLCTVWIDAAPVRANDGYIDGVAGSPSVSRKEHPQIRMESEKVVLTLLAGDKYRTDARFKFVNDSGKNVTVRMGFPEGSSIEEDEYLKKESFLSFATTVNGKRVLARRTVVKDFGDTSHVWWIKTVAFAPHERKNVRVMALSRVGKQGVDNGMGYGYIGQMGYGFTGANWKGSVARSDLEVRFPLDGVWAVSALSLDDKGATYWKPAAETGAGVGVLRKTWRNWQAQSSVTFSLRRAMPGWMDSEPEDWYEERAQELANTVTVRAGHGEVALGAGAPTAFVRDGISFVAFRALPSDNKPQPGAPAQWNAKTRTATLQYGPTKLTFMRGRAMMKVRRGDAPAQEIALPVPPQMLKFNDAQALYVPMAAPVRALGMKLKVEPSQHRYSIDK